MWNDAHLFSSLAEQNIRYVGVVCQLEEQPPPARIKQLAQRKEVMVFLEPKQPSDMSGLALNRTQPCKTCATPELLHGLVQVV